MKFTLDIIEDKIEFFEASNLATLEKKINDQIEANKAILLTVHSVSHQLYVHPETNKKFYSAVVHFKSKK
ncbi:MAG: YrzA family protein [Bacillaceae bacterium]